MGLSNLLTDRLPILASARQEYIHNGCQTRTLLAGPRVTQKMWCCRCRQHFPLTEFRWVADGTTLTA